MILASASERCERATWPERAARRARARVGGPAERSPPEKKRGGPEAAPSVHADNGLEPEAERHAERPAAALTLERDRIRRGRRRLPELRALDVARRQPHRVERAVRIGIDRRVVANDGQ